MITLVRLEILTDAERDAVLGIYRKALRQEDALLTVQEAAELYGFSYATLRRYASQKRIRTKGRGLRTRITHKAMRAYLSSKRIAGRPRMALKAGQTAIPNN